MALPQLLTLLTDFGLQDVYIGIMKGIIAQIHPTLIVIDLTHDIPPQNIAAARFNLMTAFPHFPKGTVHVAVVDPGVGSQRRAIALHLTNGFLVGPDNGIFSGIATSINLLAAIHLTNPRYWYTSTPSSTFHGRDIFAPVGAYLAAGTPLSELGETIDPSTLVQLPFPEWTQTESEIRGYIQHSDRFGNLITNIPASAVQDKTWSVHLGQLIIPSKQTFAESPVGAVLGLIGSHGWVEIAINHGNAQLQLQLSLGDPLQVIIHSD